MGKWTDKLYITRTECASGDHFGARAAKSKYSEELETEVSIDLCSLTLLPWDKPVCTLDGRIYDHLNALDKFENVALVELHFGPGYSCPVTFKDLRGKGVRVVAIRTSGWVYEASVIEEVCRNGPPSTWRDPVTDISFTRSDIITLKPRENVIKEKNSPLTNLATNTNTTTTTTSIVTTTNNNITKTNTDITSNIGVLATVGRVSIRLNMGGVQGDLHFELNCREQPVACKAFIEAALLGHYVQAPIYRLLPSSLFQAGRADHLDVLCRTLPSPAGTHNQKGLLGLVPIKPGRYSRHLYVTMGGTPALDGANVVIGRVVAGWRVLEKLKDVPVRADTCMPAIDCFIEDVIVVDNPFSP